jgi:hypothetical protein
LLDVNGVKEMTDVSLGVGQQLAQAVKAIRSNGPYQVTDAILRGDGPLLARVASTLG